MVVEQSHRGSLVVSGLIAVALIVSVALMIAGCKPDNVTVMRTPDTDSSVTRIETSQFEQVVPFPKPKPVPPRKVLKSIKQAELAEEIASNSDLVISRFSQLAKVSLACNEEGVCWLSEYIDEKHDDWSAATVNNLVDTLGSYYGECIRKEFGGQWYRTDSQVELRINSGQSCYPFDLLRKHIENSPADSILNSFESISRTFKSSNSTDADET